MSRKREHFYKGKYFFALYDKEENLKYTCDNPYELSELLGRTVQDVYCLLSKEIKRIHLGSEFLELYVLEVDNEDL